MQLPWHFLSPSSKEEKNPPQKKTTTLYFRKWSFLPPKKLNKRLIKFSRKKLKNKS